MKSLGKNADIVFSVLVIGNGLDDFTNGSGCLDWSFGSNAGRLSEIFQQSAIKAIENRKMGFMDFRAERVPRPIICSNKIRDCTGRKKTIFSILQDVHTC